MYINWKTFQIYSSKWNLTIGLMCIYIHICKAHNKFVQTMQILAALDTFYNNKMCAFFGMYFVSISIASNQQQAFLTKIYYTISIATDVMVICTRWRYSIARIVCLLWVMLFTKLKTRIFTANIVLLILMLTARPIYILK